MESLIPPLPSASPILISAPRRRLSLFPISAKPNDSSSSSPDRHLSDSSSSSPDRHLSITPFSKDAAMGLVLSAAAGTGWTTPSGMEGPSVPAAGSAISTFPWSLFTKSPRRRMRVAFTCNVCGMRTTRAINPHAYTAGTVFVQCCGCNVFHKLVDNLNLFHEMKCYVSPSFRYKGDAPFNYLGDAAGDDDGMFPIM